MMTGSRTKEGREEGRGEEEEEKEKERERGRTVSLNLLLRAIILRRGARQRIDKTSRHV